jgi:predicted DNA-binding protein (MmcQ/YjbR family)
MEDEIFIKAKFNTKKLMKYGFKKVKSDYVYECFLNDDFKAIISINKDNKVSGKVFDITVNDEYLNFRVNNENGSFSNKIRNDYKEVLIDILNNCCDKSDFIFDQTNRIAKYIKDKYDVNPEFLWNDSPDCGIFRNKSDKWFGIIMDIDKGKIIKEMKGKIEVINLKLDKYVNDYLKENGVYQAYHMNKKNWVSIILDDTLTDEYIYKLIDISYYLTKK